MLAPFASAVERLQWTLSPLQSNLRIFSMLCLTPAEQWTRICSRPNVCYAHLLNTVSCAVSHFLVKSELKCYISSRERYSICVSKTFLSLFLSFRVSVLTLYSLNNNSKWILQILAIISKGEQCIRAYTHHLACYRAEGLLNHYMTSEGTGTAQTRDILPMSFPEQ